MAVVLITGLKLVVTTAVVSRVQKGMALLYTLQAALLREKTSTSMGTSTTLPFPSPRIRMVTLPLRVLALATTLRKLFRTTMKR